MAAESYVSVELLLLWLLLITTTAATFFLQRYQKTSAIPPSSAAMALGIVCGGIVNLAGLSDLLRFSPAVFFYGLLPPIVFAAGYTLKKRTFFANLGTISVFAVAGTLISTLVFGLLTYLLVLIGIVRRSHLGPSPLIECMLYGALISATDPVATLSVFSEIEVPPILYNLVFGESVLNDAVAIILASTLEEFYSTSITWGTLPKMAWRFAFIGVGSLLTGVGVALACAFVLKRFQLSAPAEARSPGQTHDVAFNSNIYEIVLVVMSAYLAYLVAECTSLSGIVALFFSAIAHAHYSSYRPVSCPVSFESRIALRAFFELCAFLSELFVFIYLGLQVAMLGQRTLDWGLIVTGVPFCLVARAANIFPLSWLLNLRRRAPLPGTLQTMLWAVGLRGAVAYGIALNLPQVDAESADGVPAIESATLIIVVTSTLLFGGLTGPLLDRLDLRGVGDDEVAALAFMQRDAALSPEAALQMAREARVEGASDLHARWKSLDSQFFKPLFGGRMALHEPQAQPLFSLALPLQRGSGGLGSFSDDGRDEDGATGLDDDLLTGSIGERDPMLTYHGAPFYLFSGYQSQSVQSRGLRSPGAQEVQMMDGAALQSLKPDKVNGFEPAFAENGLGDPGDDDYRPPEVLRPARPH